MIGDQSCLPPFLAAFFCRRGSRGLFFFANFGTFGFAGVATPTAVAIFPAASPMVFAAFTKAPSGGAFTGSGEPSVGSFFFAMPAHSTLSDSLLLPSQLSH
jgi:hypothetical protein